MTDPLLRRSSEEFPEIIGVSPVALKIHGADPVRNTRFRAEMRDFKFLREGMPAVILQNVEQPDFGPAVFVTAAGRKILHLKDHGGFGRLVRIKLRFRGWRGRDGNLGIPWGLYGHDGLERRIRLAGDRHQFSVSAAGKIEEPQILFGRIEFSKQRTIGGRGGRIGKPCMEQCDLLQTAVAFHHRINGKPGRHPRGFGRRSFRQRNVLSSVRHGEW